MHRYWVLIVLALVVGSLLTLFLASYAYLSLPSSASATYILEASKNVVDSTVSQGLLPVYHVRFFYPIKPGEEVVRVSVQGLKGDYSIVVVHDGIVSTCSASSCELQVENKYPFIGFDVFIEVHKLYLSHVFAFVKISVERR